jgi:hypothetical protein
MMSQMAVLFYATFSTDSEMPTWRVHVIHVAYFLRGEGRRKEL